jgi:predicted kinase
VFARESERSAIDSVAREAGVPFTGIFLTAELALRLQRISRRSGDASDATVAVAEAQEEYDLGRVAWTMVDACGTLEATAELCMALLPRSSLCRSGTRQG